MWQKEHCDRAFATDKVTSTGQIIAGIVGTSKRIAQKAASLGIFSSQNEVKGNGFTWNGLKDIKLDLF